MNSFKDGITAGEIVPFYNFENQGRKQLAAVIGSFVNVVISS